MDCIDSMDCINSIDCMDSVGIVERRDSWMNEKKRAEITAVLSGIPLFAALSDDALYGVVDGSEYSVYSHGELIGGRGPCLPVIISGSAAVLGKNPERNGVVLRMLKAGSVFGVSFLFNEDESAISIVRAESETEALLIPQSVISGLIHRDGDFAERYIRLLGVKIRFLGSKIEAFTSGSAEERLARHLIALACEGDDTDGETCITLESSVSRLADMLNIGRASLYRALKALEEKGFIRQNERHITITDRAALRAWLDLR